MPYTQFEFGPENFTDSSALEFQVILKLIISMVQDIFEYFIVTQLARNSLFL